MTILTRAVNILWRTDARLAAVGLLMTALLAASLAGIWLDPRYITGAPAWLKPAKFAASIAIFTLTLAWVFRYLPGWVRTRRTVSWITSVTLLLEIAIIDLQAWRGTTSHFNVATPLDAALFNVMGAAILVQTLSVVAVAVALWRQAFADRAMGWALRLGIVITIAGGMTGGLMVAPTSQQRADAGAGRRLAMVGGHTVGAPDGGSGLPGTGWSRTHGDLRIAHFVGLHGLQFLPLVAFALTRRLPGEAARVRLVWSLSASYVALFAVLLWQALRGQSIVAPDAMTIAALAIWALATAALVWLSAFHRTRHRGGFVGRPGPADPASGRV